jgi:c(7)-type cytochrome triheme protein
MRRTRAAALWLAALALLALAAPRGRAAAPDPPADGFDHITHRGRVEVRGAAPPPCSRCHALGPAGRLAGAPGHAACFGDCHGPPPRGGRGARDPAVRRVCQACHRPALIARLERGALARIPADFPPYQRDRDFALTLSHAAHGAVARGCRACHAAPAEPVRARPGRRARPAGPHAQPAHARCAACHAGGRPGGVGMDSCSACHSPAVGSAAALAPHRDAGRFPVDRTFSHRRHLARAPAGLDPCRACHAGAAAARGDRVPTPKKEQCRPCHDGRRAFSLVEPACRRCHAAPQREEMSPGPPRGRFQHRAHDPQRPSRPGPTPGAPAPGGAPASGAARASGGGAATGAAGAAPRPAPACSDCHALDARGAPAMALRGHAPCANAGCHAEDFAAAAPRTCGVCHVRGEPWRELHADPLPAPETEFGVDFSHRAHLGRPALAAAPCTRCHRPAPGGRFAPAPGHGACAGADCHARARGAGPPLTRCGGCHALGLADRRERAALRRTWSVRERFDHRPHAAEPSAPARPVPCAACHEGVPDSASTGDIRPPGKPSCARCHDGRAAFKLTGHTCARCHLSPAARVRTATGSTSRTDRTAPPR